MKLLIASIANRSGASEFDGLIALYLGRLGGYVPAELAVYRSEEAFFESMEKQRSRVTPFLVLLDSRGKALSSDQFAARVGRERDDGRQLIVFAIGPANGWSGAARGQAGLLLSFGPITLPHELARVVLCEQVYRAFTILAGHPYHSGH